MVLNFGGGSLFNESKNEGEGFGANPKISGLGAVAKQANWADTSISGNYVDIPNATVTLTVDADEIVLISASCLTAGITNGEGMNIKLQKDSVDVAGTLREHGDTATNSGNIAFTIIDAPGEGDFTYKVQGKSDDGTGNILNGFLVGLVFKGTAEFSQQAG